jgi:hypothetical protein
MLHNGAGECSYRSHNEHDIYKTLVPIFLCAILDSSLPLVHTRLERYPKDTRKIPERYPARTARFRVCNSGRL